MTYETLVFIRQIIGQFSVKVGEPDFRTLATSLIAALDELDREIAAFDDSDRRLSLEGTHYAGNSG